MVSANHWFASIETYTFQLYLTLVDLSLSFCFCWLLHHASLFLERCPLFGKAWREWSQSPYCHYLRDLNWRLWCVEVRTFHWTCWSPWSVTRGWTLRRHWFVGSGKLWRVSLMLNVRCFFGLFGDERDSQELSLIFVEGTSCFRYVKCGIANDHKKYLNQDPTQLFWFFAQKYLHEHFTQVFNNYSPSPSGLWFNSSWNRRLHGLFAQKPWRQEE